MMQSKFLREIENSSDFESKIRESYTSYFNACLRTTHTRFFSVGDLFLGKEGLIFLLYSEYAHSSEAEDVLAFLIGGNIGSLIGMSVEGAFGALALTETWKSGIDQTLTTLPRNLVPTANRISDVREEEKSLPADSILHFHQDSFFIPKKSIKDYTVYKSCLILTLQDKDTEEHEILHFFFAKNHSFSGDVYGPYQSFESRLNKELKAYLNEEDFTYESIDPRHDFKVKLPSPLKYIRQYLGESPEISIGDLEHDPKFIKNILKVVKTLDENELKKAGENIKNQNNHLFCLLKDVKEYCKSSSKKQGFAFLIAAITGLILGSIITFNVEDSNIFVFLGATLMTGMITYFIALFVLASLGMRPGQVFQKKNGFPPPKIMDDEITLIIEKLEKLLY